MMLGLMLMTIACSKDDDDFMVTANEVNTTAHVNAPADVYQQWCQVLDRAIVEKRMATRWTTSECRDWKYADFTVTEEKYHGVSMFIPQDPTKGNYTQYNEDIILMAWYAATN